jgi:hypothetical protein
MSMPPIRPNVRPLPSLLCKTTLFRSRFNSGLSYNTEGDGGCPKQTGSKAEFQNFVFFGKDTILQSDCEVVIR